MAFYAPALCWAQALPDTFTIQMLTKLYLYPTNRHVQYVMRIGLLLGVDFCQWLYGKWHEKWKGYTQPPSFYWTFENILSEMKGTDARLLAARASPASRFSLEGATTATARELLEKPEQASLMLSRACMRVFRGDNASRTTARNLDYLAYGTQLQARASQIASGVIEAIGGREAGDVVEVGDAE